MSGETEAAPSSWTIDSLHEHWREVAAASERRHLDRCDALQHALDAAVTTSALLLAETNERYSQRLDAQEKATTVALASLRAETAARAAAAEKAIGKAEAAAEKRFDAVNEFRSLVQDILANAMPRQESVALYNSLVEKLTDSAARSSDALARVHTRLDRSEGGTTAVEKKEDKTVAGWGLGLAVAGGVIGLLGFLSALIFAIIAMQR